MNNNISNVVNVLFAPLSGDQKVSEKKLSDQAQSGSIDPLQKPSEKKTEKDSGLLRELTFEEAAKLAEKGNKLLQTVERNLEFKVDDSTKQIVMSIVDRDTGEVIRQVPSKEMLALAKQIQEMRGKSGGLIQGRA